MVGAIGRTAKSLHFWGLDKTTKKNKVQTENNLFITQPPPLHF